MALKASKVYNIRVPAPLDAEIQRQAEATGQAASAVLREFAVAGMGAEAQQRHAAAQQGTQARQAVEEAARDLEAALGRLRAAVR